MPATSILGGISQESTLRKIQRVLGTAFNQLGQMRVSVDNAPNISTVATVTTVTTVTNLGSIGGAHAALDQYYAGRSAVAGIRSRIS